MTTISINALVDDNGIIKKAGQSKEQQENEIIAYGDVLSKLQEEYNNTMADPPGPLQEITADTPAGTAVKTPDEWTTLEGTAISDGNGTAIPLPKGFYYVGGDYDTGLVISDSPSDANKGTSYEIADTLIGNQFVWIPVADEEDLTRTAFDSTTGQPTTGLNTNYTEPYSSGYGTEEDEYNIMKTQVLLYNGFYIGRYEAGVDSTELRTTSSIAQTVVCKKGVAPYNYVPWGKNVSDIGPAEETVNGETIQVAGAVYLAQNFDTQEGYTSVESTLCYGSQWDAMCRYIGDSQRTTSTKDAPDLTGSVSTDMSKNIYDLAGNCWEWTMEAYGADSRVRRGGFYGYDGAVFYRFYPGADTDRNSFRLTLYIK